MHTRFLGRERSERGPQSELGTQCGGIVEWKLSFCTEIWGAGLGWSVVLGPELVRILLLPLCGPGPVSECVGGGGPGASAAFQCLRWGVGDLRVLQLFLSTPGLPPRTESQGPG